MTDFIHDDFLLGTRTARRLYHEHAAGLPIVDYHSHLDPRELADDRRFDTLADVWIVTDPYKHRAMRIAGVGESFITGSATRREKFDHWAAVVPQTLGNPLFHWTALELRRYFGIRELLAPATAEWIWNEANARLAAPSHSARGLLGQAHVECLCTSDRLLDDLASHARLAASAFPTRILPSLRADELLAVEAPDYVPWVHRLAATNGAVIADWDAFSWAVTQQLDRFHQAGCRLADQALDDFVYASPSPTDTARLFARRIAGDPLSAADLTQLKSVLLRFLATEYARRGWSLQLHLGAQRQTSSRLRALAGPAGGYASIGRSCDVASVCRFLDELEAEGLLPRTILYTLNPADNAVLAALTGSFTAAGVRGKTQFGPAWWYNDHRAGIARHLEDLASYGLLASFVGMTTDSRCLLSMARHEYFRRILCDFLGARVEAGEYPCDETLLAQLVRDLAYENARRWLTAGEST
jgi:glucuronate isomerase